MIPIELVFADVLGFSMLKLIWFSYGPCTHASCFRLPNCKQTDLPLLTDGSNVVIAVEFEGRNELK